MTNIVKKRNNVTKKKNIKIKTRKMRGGSNGSRINRRLSTIIRTFGEPSNAFLDAKAKAKEAEERAIEAEERAKEAEARAKEARKIEATRQIQATKARLDRILTSMKKGDNLLSKSGVRARSQTGRASVNPSHLEKRITNKELNNYLAEQNKT